MSGSSGAPWSLLNSKPVEMPSCQQESDLTFTSSHSSSADSGLGKGWVGGEKTRSRPSGSGLDLNSAHCGTKTTSIVPDFSRILPKFWDISLTGRSLQSRCCPGHAQIGLHTRAKQYQRSWLICHAKTAVAESSEGHCGGGGKTKHVGVLHHLLVITAKLLEKRQRSLLPTSCLFTQLFLSDNE